MTAKPNNAAAAAANEKIVDGFARVSATVLANAWAWDAARVLRGHARQRFSFAGGSAA